jgi:hypothetical protein
VCCGYRNNASCAAGQGHAQIVYGQAATIPASTGTALSAYYSGVQVSTLSITSTSSSAQTTSSSSSPANSATAAHGLSSGAKIGIGVGVGVGGLLLIAITIAVTYFCFKRRYKSTTPFQAGKEISDYQRARATKDSTRRRSYHLDLSHVGRNLIILGRRRNYIPN